MRTFNLKGIPEEDVSVIVSREYNDESTYVDYKELPENSNQDYIPNPEDFPLKPTPSQLAKSDSKDSIDLRVGDSYSEIAVFDTTLGRYTVVRLATIDTFRFVLLKVGDRIVVKDIKECGLWGEVNSDFCGKLAVVTRIDCSRHYVCIFSEDADCYEQTLIGLSHIKGLIINDI